MEETMARTKTTAKPTNRAHRQRRQLKEDGLGPDMTGVLTADQLVGNGPSEGQKPVTVQDFEELLADQRTDEVETDDGVLESDPAVDKIFEALAETLPEDLVNPVTTAPPPPKNKLLEGLMERFSKANETFRARITEMRDAPEILAFLDNIVFPAQKEARAKGDTAAVNDIAACIREGRNNKTVADALDSRSKNLEQQRANAAKQLLDDKIEGMRNQASATTLQGAFDQLEQTGEPQILPPLVLADGNAVLVKVTREPQADGRTFRVAQVLEETRPHFQAQKVWENGEPGAFPFIPPYFQLKDLSKRKEDPFDALKAALAELHQKEYEAQKAAYHAAQDAERRQQHRDEAAKRLEQARTEPNLTPISEFVLNGTVGRTLASTKFLMRGTPRFLEAVLVRGTNGDIVMPAWGPPPAEKDDPYINDLRGVHLTIECDNVALAMGEDGNPRLMESGLPVARGVVTVRVDQRDFPTGDDGPSAKKRASIGAQCPILGMMLRQAVVSGLYAQYLEEKDTQPVA